MVCDGLHVWSVMVYMYGLRWPARMVCDGLHAWSVMVCIYGPGLYVILPAVNNEILKEKYSVLNNFEICIYAQKMKVTNIDFV